VNLSEHRKAIDQLDAQIVRLLNERTQHVLAIGEIKLKAGEEIYAPHRERAVLERVCKLNRGPITDDSVPRHLSRIMSSALSLEKTLTIAYLGPEATFTHQAAIKRFGSSLNYAAQKTIADVFTEVSKQRADYGVVPVENSTEGVVTHTLDMFVDSDLKIVSQIMLKVQQCLMIPRGGRKQIKKLTCIRSRSRNAAAGCKPTCRAWKLWKPPRTRARRNWRRRKKVRQPSAVCWRRKNTA
jgi:chorismate mutase / prephenate dehydratase